MGGLCQLMAYGIPNHPFIFSGFSFQMLPDASRVPLLGGRALKRSHCCSRSFRTSGSSPCWWRGRSWNSMWSLKNRLTTSYNNPFGRLVNTQIISNLSQSLWPKSPAKAQKHGKGMENMIQMTKTCLQYMYLLHFHDFLWISKKAVLLTALSCFRKGREHSSPVLQSLPWTLPWLRICQGAAKTANMGRAETWHTTNEAANVFIP